MKRHEGTRVSPRQGQGNPDTLNFRSVNETKDPSIRTQKQTG